MKEKGFVYILRNLNNKYYIGASTHPEQRLDEHNRGKTISTRNKGPWKIEFKQEFSSIEIAKNIEYKLKQLKRRDYIERIIKDGVIKLSP